MFQLEVKRWLMEHRFPPCEGWNLTVDIDAMERANGGHHPAEKKETAAVAEAALRSAGAQIVAHPVHGRADMVATKPGSPTFVIEVEGDSTRQKEQAMYSALGQLVISMGSADENTKFLLAVPDSKEWERQLFKIPARVKQQLGLETVLVSESGIRYI
jgi:hypothetical protein